MHDDIYKEIYGGDYGQNWYELIPLIFLISIVPLIVYGKMMQFSGDYFKYWNGVSSGIDFFSYYKSIWIMIMTILAVIVFFIKFYRKNIKIYKQGIFIPMTIYSICIVLSTVFSDFSQIALWGFVERYEGMLILLCYVAMLFLAIHMIDNEYAIKVILIALISSAIVIGIIGIMQYFGHDLYKSMTGKSLILPKQYQSMASKLKFQFGDKIIYSTLYHYNYVGSYMAILFPLTFTLGLLIKNKFYKVVLALVSMLMFLNLILCHSRAGIIGAGIAMMVLIINIRKSILKKWKETIALLLVASIGIVGFNIYSKGMLRERIGSLFKDAETLTKGTNSWELNDVVVNANSLKIIFSDKVLKVESLKGTITFKDNNDKVIGNVIGMQNGRVVLNEEGFKEFDININDYSNSDDKSYIMKVKRGQSNISFLIYNDSFSLLNEKGKSVEIKPVEKWGFEGKEKLGSARAYIWSRSIPLLKHSVILGYGPDTFAAKFPQNDYIGKLIAYGTTDILVDKAHNLYLEIALNVGIIGLISFLAILLIYFISSIKIYFRNSFEDFFSIVGLAILVSISGYLGAGLFNDSVVSVAPIFWILLGVGISINLKLKESKDDKEKR